MDELYDNVSEIYEDEEEDGKEECIDIEEHNKEEKNELENNKKEDKTKSKKNKNKNKNKHVIEKIKVFPESCYSIQEIVDIYQ